MANYDKIFLVYRLSIICSISADRNFSDLVAAGGLVYKCMDGRFTIEEDNRRGRRYLTMAEVRELEKKLKKMEKLEKMKERREK